MNCALHGAVVSSAAAARLSEIVLASPLRQARLCALRDFGPPSAWLSAGFVRNAVFDALFSESPAERESDLDVIYLDASATDPERDGAYEHALHAACPGAWEVKNQARMAVRNGHRSYRDVADALAHFPETATAVAVRLDGDELSLLAPYGLDDLFAGVMRCAPCADPARYAERRHTKRWAERWPRLRVC